MTATPAEIEKVVRAYLDGMIYLDPDQLRRAFHPKAFVIGHWEGGLEWSSLEEFIAGCARMGAEPKGQPYYSEILSCDVTGDIATVKLTNDYVGVRYTDYLSLLNEAGRWSIVNKVFSAHV